MSKGLGRVQREVLGYLRARTEDDGWETVQALALWAGVDRSGGDDDDNGPWRDSPHDRNSGWIQAPDGTIWRQVGPHGPSRARVEAVRRALRTLRGSGLVELGLWEPHDDGRLHKCARAITP